MKRWPVVDCFELLELVNQINDLLEERERRPGVLLSKVDRAWQRGVQN
jgi:hypothetical protein